MRLLASKILNTVMANLKKEIDLNNEYIRSRAERWHNRRKMAYISLFSMIIAMLMCMFLVSTERITAISEIVIWFFIVLGSIIGAYVGFSTIEDKWNKKINGKE